ncbi:hypothetical protein C499_19467 [Halogeometricum borinquense DSM 11551]|uniref:Uncharacterized protein n=1 Tax=Halogeometricum borinquense (strain ATCC 700274 / DSM 11551 / JCM 10706 / KCTC 4070 / PR3) TaxID=469382 RepID=E4NKU6_HALBP|nr:DUF5806 family protein [Halogeometricum borinquense]ADQ65992.1 hypothetical protein Hbor_03880 [Halogeometricum borinquense DSM 11551]ELY23148.1 hypothetical protein C499_19467 [Halogeometricum borinquense DSM 11551]
MTDDDRTTPDRNGRSDADPDATTGSTEDAAETPQDGERPGAIDRDEPRPTDGDASADAEDIESVDATDSEGDDGAGATDAESTDAESTNEKSTDADGTNGESTDEEPEIPRDVQKYARFKKMDGAQYDRVNEFLRDRTYVTAREWAIARLCADFRTETGVEMTKIGENLPELVPFMTDTYTPQAVNQARSSFEGKVRKAGATFLYGAMSGFFTAEELDELMYEVSEVAKFLLEVEGVDLSVEEELEAEERISSVMREVRDASEDLRREELADEASDD